MNRNEKPLAVQVLELMIIWVDFSKTKLTLSVPLELEQYKLPKICAPKSHALSFKPGKWLPDSNTYFESDILKSLLWKNSLYLFVIFLIPCVSVP